MFGVVLEPKEKHYSGPLSQIKGFKTWKFSKEKFEKVLDVKWICVVLVNSVVSVKGEEILWILQRKSVETCQTTGKFSRRPYDESGSFKSGKMKIKSSDKKITKQVSGSGCWRQWRH